MQTKTKLANGSDNNSSKSNKVSNCNGFSSILTQKKFWETEKARGVMRKGDQKMQNPKLIKMGDLNRKNV